MYLFNWRITWNYVGSLDSPFTITLKFLNTQNSYLHHLPVQAVDLEVEETV